MTKKLGATIMRNSAFGMAARLSIKVLSFGFSVLIVRRLGAEAFGQYAAILAFVNIFAFISDLGLSPYAVRQVARLRELPDGAEQASRLYGDIVTLRLLLSILTNILVTGAAWLTGRPILMVGAIALNASGLLLYSVQGTSDAMLAGYERLDLSAWATVANQIVFVAAGGTLLALGVGYYGLIAANLLGVAVMAAICWRNGRTLGLRIARPSPGAWMALLRASLPFGVIALALGLSYKFDSVLLNIYRSDAETGYYNAVYNLVFSAAILSNVLNTSLYPSLTRQAATSPHTLPRIYERAIRYLMVMAFPIAVGMWVLADQIVVFLFKPGYLPAVPALRIVVWTAPLMFASEFLGYVVLIADKESRAARAILVSTSLNVAFNLVMVPRFGFIGASIMTVITEAVLVAQYVWTLRGLMRQINWMMALVRPVLAALIMGGLVLLLRAHVPLLINVAAGGIAYVASLVALGVVGRDEISFARGMLPSSEVTTL